jgi:hypothetical protein
LRDIGASVSGVLVASASSVEDLASYGHASGGRRVLLQSVLGAGLSSIHGGDCVDIGGGVFHVSDFDLGSGGGSESRCSAFGL